MFGYKKFCLITILVGNSQVDISGAEGSGTSLNDLECVHKFLDGVNLILIWIQFGFPLAGQHCVDLKPVTKIESTCMLDHF